jgi:hypothetical protein
MLSPLLQLDGAKKLVVAQLLMKFSSSNEESVTSPYSEPDNSDPQPLILFLEHF